MKKILFLLLLFFSLITNTNAQAFSKEATSEPIYTQKGNEKHWCPVCGMSIKKHYKTSHASKLENGTSRQYCSIRCLEKDKEEYGINENNIKVIDAKEEKLIDAKTAYYVIGSKVKGTMSKVSKLAFAKKEDAQNFIKEFGGKLSTFKEAEKQAKDSLKTDDKMVLKKKKKKIYPKGKKIFEKLCKQDIDPTVYLEINELKADIINNKLCKNLDEKKLQALTLYLWDIKRLGNLKQYDKKIIVKEKEKCPVCGMFVAKYPRWVAQIIYVDKNEKHTFSFDGVKDLMKFYFNPKKWGNYPILKDNIKEILVTDYYTQEPINGSKAFYVIGSDVYGPMGNELIPFEKKEDAINFKKDHDGTSILSFEEIIEEEVYKLDE